MNDHERVKEALFKRPICRRLLGFSRHVVLTWRFDEPVVIQPHTTQRVIFDLSEPGWQLGYWSEDEVWIWDAWGLLWWRCDEEDA